MYLIAKSWEVWALYDKALNKSRTISTEEVQAFKTLFPLLVQRQIDPFMQFHISNVSLAKLQQTKVVANDSTQPQKVAEPQRYIACKIANSWTLYDMADTNTRSLSDLEITFLHTMFGSVIGSPFTMIEAIQVAVINYSKAQQLMKLPSESFRQATKALKTSVRNEISEVPDTPHKVKL